MSTLRGIKDRARARLFERMKVETLAYAGGPAGPSETVFVRVNSEDRAAGDLAGTSLGYAEVVQTQPKLIFLHADHIPVRGNVYVVGSHEAYQVEVVEPRDGITVTAQAVRLSEAKTATYAAPGG